MECWIAGFGFPWEIIVDTFTLLRIEMVLFIWRCFVASLARMKINRYRVDTEDAIDGSRTTYYFV